MHLSDFLQSSEGDGDVILIKDEVIELDIDEGGDYGQSHWSETSSGVSSGLVEENTSGESSPAQTEASAGHCQPLGDLEARTYNKEPASKKLRFQEKNSYSDWEMVIVWFQFTDSFFTVKYVDIRFTVQAPLSKIP